ncbi:hypothetical protein ACFQRB_12200 [Halobaculum litoreum]|uniref:DNA primase n=1 Tax=Halobaculum litoreum TaxID=3031998 RepID=A0ABD5XT51_9EURY
MVRRRRPRARRLRRDGPRRGGARGSPDLRDPETLYEDDDLLADERPDFDDAAAADEGDAEGDNEGNEADAVDDGDLDVDDLDLDREYPS